MSALRWIIILCSGCSQRVGTQTRRRDGIVEDCAELGEKSSRENKEVGGVPEAIRDRFPPSVQLLKNESPACAGTERSQRC